MEPRCTGTRNRDPGSRCDQEFWCRGFERQTLRHVQAQRNNTEAWYDDMDGRGKRQRQGGDGPGKGTGKGREWETGNGE